VAKRHGTLQLQAWDPMPREGCILLQRCATGRRRAWQVLLCILSWSLQTRGQCTGADCCSPASLAAACCWRPLWCNVVRGLRSRLSVCCADLVTPYGYPLNQYTVPTRDGYLLGLFRIPHGAGVPNSTDRWASISSLPRVIKA